MKLIHDERASTMRKHDNRLATSRLAKYLIPAAIAISPLLFEGNAKAQQSQPGAAQPAAPAQSMPGTSSVAGDQAVLIDGSARTNVYVKDPRSIPVVTVQGPARLTIRFYPTVARERFTGSSSEYSRPITYSLNPMGGAQSPQTYAAVTRMSSIRAECQSSSPGGAPSECIDSTALVVGTAIELTLPVPAGPHVFSVSSPNGFLEVVRSVPIVARPPEPVRPPEPQPEPRAQPAEPAPRPAPEPERRPIVTFDGERTWLHSLGSMENSGDINLVQPVVYAWLNNSFAIVATAMFSSYGLQLDTESAQAKFRNYSGDLGAGIAYRNGEHIVYGLGFAGYRAMVADTLSLSDGRFTSELSHFFEYGGQAAYRWGDHLGVRVTGSNNPFNPLSVRAWGALPYTWAGHSYPFIEADMLWLHAMTPAGSSSTVGAARLDENAFHIRGIAGVPIYPLGPVTPYALLGGEMEASGAGVRNGSFIWGGLLRLSLMQSLEIEAGMATNLQWAPIALLRMSYSR